MIMSKSSSLEDAASEHHISVMHWPYQTAFRNHAYYWLPSGEKTGK